MRIKLSKDNYVGCKSTTIPVYSTFYSERCSLIIYFNPSYPKSSLCTNSHFNYNNVMVILHDIRHRDTRGVKQDWHIKPSHCSHQLYDFLLILVFDVKDDTNYTVQI